MMENYDIEQHYWFCVHDSADLLAHSNTDIETFIADVLDYVIRVKPESRQAYQLLGILDQISQQKDIDDANEAANEVFKA